MRGQKGITLVALIITIVVLLILAVVAITAITDTELIPHASNATTKWNDSVNAEGTQMNNYVDTIEKYNKFSK